MGALEAASCTERPGAVEDASDNGAFASRDMYLPRAMDLETKRRTGDGRTGIYKHPREGKGQNREGKDERVWHL